MTVFTNKRKYVRLAAKGVAAYLHLDGHRKGCTVENISAGGLFLRTDRFFPVGSQLTFELVRKDTQQAFTVAGWVVGVITPELAKKTKLAQGVRIQFGRQKLADADDLQSLLKVLRRGLKPRPVLEETRVDESALLDDLEEPGTQTRTKPRASLPLEDVEEVAALHRKISKLEAELAERDEQLALALRLLKTHGLDKG